MRTLRYARERLLILLSLAVIVQLLALAENRLCPRLGKDGLIEISLSNADGIAGLQFTVNASGIALVSYEETERSVMAGLRVYQHLQDGSTLNVVILAPYQDSLPPGEGAIGKVSLTLPRGESGGSARVWLSRVVACDRRAELVEMRTVDLSWNLPEEEGDGTCPFTLEENFPNPFNSTTSFEFKVPGYRFVTFRVFDALGRERATLVNEYKTAGTYRVRWDAGNLPTGVYFARLQVNNRIAVKRIILVK